MSSAIRIVIPGAPRTKKTSNRIVKMGKFSKVLPSEAFMEWFKEAMRMVPAIKSFARREGIELPFKGPVHVKALFFLENAIQGDLVGYAQAIGDFLQEPKINFKVNPPRLTRDGAGLITDDKMIASWDGSRVRIDRQNPRIEIEIRPYQEHMEMVTGHEIYGLEEGAK